MNLHMTYCHVILQVKITELLIKAEEDLCIKSNPLQGSSSPLFEPARVGLNLN